MLEEHMRLHIPGERPCRWLTLTEEIDDQIRKTRAMLSYYYKLMDMRELCQS